MDIVALIPTLYVKLSTFLIVFTRISAVFSTFFLFRNQLINARVTVALTTILSIYVILLIPAFNMPPTMALLPILLQQFLVGFLAGFILNIVFEVIRLAGQLIATQVGFAMAAVLDPLFGHITELTQFYSYSMLLVFFLLNGHLFLIHLIVTSFSVIPINYVMNHDGFLVDVLRYSSILFYGGVTLSISILVCILITNVSLAVMTRFAPQFNIFSIGMGLSVIIGLVCIYLLFFAFVDQYDGLIQNGFQQISTVYQSMR